MKRFFLSAFIALFLSASVAKSQVNSDTIEYEIQGKLIQRSGSVVKMQMSDGAEMPTIGQHGEMSKHFDTELFGGKVSGWLAIGDMKITKIENRIITFNLIRELSVINENGVKKEHFVPGREVKFVWKLLVSADEAAFKKGQNIVETDMDKALQFYKQAASINPLHDRALNMIGMIMNQKGEKDSSLVYFKRASDIDPKSAQYAKNACITIYASGGAEQGYAYARKAVDNDKLEAEAWYLRGLMYYLIKKDTVNAEEKKQILNDLDKAVGLASGESFYFGERAFLRSRFGDMAGACEDAKKAKELGADNGDELVKNYCKE